MIGALIVGFFFYSVAPKMDFLEARGSSDYAYFAD